MRTLTLSERDRLAGRTYNVHLRVRLRDAGGVFRELTTLGGVDWVDGYRERWNRDQLTAEGEIYLRRDTKTSSISPLITGSTLNRDGAGAYGPLVYPNRELQILEAITAKGALPATSDWKLAMHGIAGDPEFGGDDGRITLPYRDLGARLADTYIQDERVYGSAAGVGIQSIVQGMLNDNGHGSVAVYLPAPVDWIIDQEFIVPEGLLLDEIRKILMQRGLNARYLYHAASDSFRFTLYLPDRNRTTVDATFGPDEYLSLPSVKISAADVRNIVEVKAFDGVTGATLTARVSDTRSIAEFGPLFFGLDEAATSLIDTQAEVDQLAYRILADVAPPSEHVRMELLYFPAVEIGDRYTILPDGIHFDQSRTLAVQEYEKQVEMQTHRTTCTLSGKAAGLHREWLKRDKAYAPETATPTVVLDATTTEQDALAVVLRLAPSSSIGLGCAVYTRCGVDVATVPFTRTPAVGVLKPGDVVHLRVERPPQRGRVVHAEMFAEDSAGLQSETERAIINADPQAEILALAMNVDTATQRVHTRVEVDSDARSIRYRMLRGDDPAWPTDAEVEAGPVVGISGSLTLICTDFTIGPRERVRIRVAPYRNADGTGPLGNRDHGGIGGAQIDDPRSRDDLNSVTISADPATREVRTRVEVTPEARSIRYRLTRGANPTWPTDLSVESGAVLAIDQSLTFICNDFKIGADEDVRVRVAAYRNADGTGALGVTDHGAIIGAELVDVPSRSYVDAKTAGTGGNVNIRSDTEPTTRPGGAALVVGDQWTQTSNGDAPWTWSGTLWVRAYTRIDGGNIETGTINANITFAGILSAATGTFGGSLQAATGTFGGSLQAATGTFAGALQAATGTFAGALKAATGDFSGLLKLLSGADSIQLQTPAGVLLGSIVANAAEKGLQLRSAGGKSTVDVTEGGVRLSGPMVQALGGVNGGLQARSGPSFANSSVTLDFRQGSSVLLVLNLSCAVYLTGGKAGSTYRVLVKQAGAGGYTTHWDELKIFGPTGQLGLAIAQPSTGVGTVSEYDLTCLGADEYLIRRLSAGHSPPGAAPTAAPSALTATDTSYCSGTSAAYEVSLKFTIGDTGAQHEVYRGSTRLATLDAGRNAYLDGGILPGSYSYYVRAIKNGVVGGSSNTASVSVGTLSCSGGGGAIL